VTNTKINISTHNLGGIESGVARTLKKKYKEESKRKYMVSVVARDF
jgi:hypothetical protein